ncbi:MAG: MAPEG family protein [Hyphomicrobiales bacterium]
MLSVTLVFVAILTLLQIPMTIAVGVKRLKTDIHFMDGGNEDLMWRMRAHGNFTETVPIALFSLAGAELVTTPVPILWTLGALLIAGRVLHYGTVRRYGWANGRAGGMAMTMASMGGSALCILAGSYGFFA